MGPGRALGEGDMRKSASWILAAALAAPVAPALAQEGPEISDSAYCASAYGALAKARTRRAKAPKQLFATAGFFSIDFAERQRAVQAKHPKDGFAITFHQQALEEAFDLAGYAEADGKPVPDAASGAVTLAVTTARRCDRDNGFKPMLLERLAASPAPPVEPYSCAVNYMTIGLGMKDPAAQKQAMARIAAMMARFDPGMAQDSVWRDVVRERLRTDAQERNKAVGARQVTPEQLFAFSQGCDRLLATP